MSKFNWHLFLLFAMTIISGTAGVWMMMKFGPTAPAVGLLVTSYGSFSGGLLVMLKADSGNNNPPPPPPPIVDSKPPAPSVQVQ